MEKSWQNKCSLSWSSELPQGSQNQVEMNVDSCLPPYITQAFRSIDKGFIQDPMLLNNSNSSPWRSGKPEVGNSFLTLLSGPLPQVQSGIQQVSSLKSTIASGNGADRCTPVPSRVESISSYSRGSGLPGVQVANLSRNTGFNRPVSCSLVSGIERATDLSSPQWSWHVSSNLTKDGHHNTANVQGSWKVPSVNNSAVRDTFSPFASGRLRVFCMAKSGDLLISSTGLIGVVCSCHGLQMSISKFCEHLGLCAINPGAAVYLESGETIAQWRRLYFLNLGIRIPDDNSGWDWPENVPTTGGLIKCNTTLQNTSKKSGKCQSTDPSTASAWSSQCWNNLGPPKNTHLGVNIMDKTSTKVIHNAERRHVPDVRTMQTVTGTPTSGGLTTARSPLQNSRDGNGYQSISEYIDFLTKCGNPLISNQNLGKVKIHGNDSVGNRGSSSREAFIRERIAIPSNIELRLGQPSQQSHTLDASAIPGVKPQNSIFHSSVNSRVAEETRQNLCTAPSNTSSSRRQNDFQLNLMQLMPRSCNVTETHNVKQSNTNIPTSSQISKVLSNLITSEENVQSWDSSCMVNYNGPLMSRVPHGESQNINDSSGFSRNVSSRIELNKSVLGHLDCADKGKGTQFFADTHFYDAPKEEYLLHNRAVAGSSPLTGVFSGSSLPSSVSVHEKQGLYWHQRSGTLDDASGISNMPSQLGNTSCLGSSIQLDYSLLKGINPSTVNDRSSVPLSAVLPSFCSTSPIRRPNLMPSLSNKEKFDVSPHFLDENLRSLALKNIVDSAKQDRTISYGEMDPQHRRVCVPSTIEVQRRGSSLATLASEQQKEQPYLTKKHDAPEFSTQQLQNFSSRYMNFNTGKLTDVTGVNNWCSSSSLSGGIPFQSNEDCIRCSCSHGPPIDKQPLLRLGRAETNFIISGEHERCCQKDTRPSCPWKCGCTVRSAYLHGDYVSRGKISGVCNEHVGRNSDDNAKLVTSSFDNVQAVCGEYTVGLNQSEKLKRQIPMQIDSHTSQWRDVPSKRSGVSTAIVTEKPTALYDAKATINDQSLASISKGFNGTQEAESLTEQQMSNVCSGFSAPAVTEVTVDVNNLGSCTVEAGSAKYSRGHAIDEESGIEKGFSSDDTLESQRSTKTVNISRNLDFIEGGCSSGLPRLTSNGSTDNLRTPNSFGMKKVQKRPSFLSSVQGSIKHTQQLKRALRTRKKRKPTKWKRLDSSFLVSGINSLLCDSPRNTVHTELQPLSSRGTQTPTQPNHDLSRSNEKCSTEPSGIKRKRSALASAKTLLRKRDFHGVDCVREGGGNGKRLPGDDTSYLKKSKLSGEKKPKQCWIPEVSRLLREKEVNHVDAAKTAKYRSVDRAKNFSSNQVGTRVNKTKPVVRGKSGIISIGKLPEGRTKAKLVSLSTIMKSTRRLSTAKSEDPGFSETNVICCSRSNQCKDKPFALEGKKDNEHYKVVLKSEVIPGSSTSEIRKEGFTGNEVPVPEPSMLEKDVGPRMPEGNYLHSHAPLKSRFKEARKRSLCELEGKGKDLISEDICIKETSELKTKFKSYRKSFIRKVAKSKCRKGELFQVSAKKYVKEHEIQAFLPDLDAFCSVCGSSNKDEMNCLLECHCCSIRVHQACYGVSRAPRGGRWCCRPCKENSKNAVCVLCGYESGAMTQALRSRNIVKGLLKVWGIVNESMSTSSIPLSETSRDGLTLLDISSPGNEGCLTPRVMPSAHEPSAAVAIGNSHDERGDKKSSSSLRSNFRVHNTVTAGVRDPTIKQWVHMVCGLWTPETRCPNVDTMSTFDVSGAHCLSNVVCSLCNRPGGSCIRCRVVNCSITFHPWCAHQKGLLQSEVEGIDNEKVGFYGRCMLHATYHGRGPDVHLIETTLDTLGRGEYTCARTEGYKGCKKSGIGPNFSGLSVDNVVPQEQINAWLHINRQKHCTRPRLKPLVSDIEYDSRKEYARSKQTKGSKHLVVYKSGIHGLGLYTSQFICRGSMVVEYIGEIIGQRVCDKREVEYQSGRKLPYKGACYFFKIDKEHIIDATRKGGIARFVNHSCLPNCVAKIISVRNEKKVVFFAERDIYPGEEITYDYHFNHEDEGKKIPCFCNSKNCRRYLN